MLNYFYSFTGFIVGIFVGVIIKNRIIYFAIVREILGFLLNCEIVGAELESIVENFLLCGSFISYVTGLEVIKSLLKLGSCSFGKESSWTIVIFLKPLNPSYVIYEHALIIINVETSRQKTPNILFADECT